MEEIEEVILEATPVEDNSGSNSDSQPSNSQTAKSRSGGTAQAAKNFVDAASQAVDIIDTVISFIPGLSQVKAVTKVMPIARNVAHVAPVITEKAAPVINAVAEAAPEIAGKVQATATQVGKNVQTVAGTAAKNVSTFTASAAENVGNAIKQGQENAKQRKAQSDTRKALLETAAIHIDGLKFMKNWKASTGEDEDTSSLADTAEVEQAVAGFLGAGESSGYLNFSGCYLILVFDSLILFNDYTKYRDIFVGASTDVGQAIHSQLTGQGNIDIYADFKYKKNLQIFIYPCKEHDLASLESSMIEVFGSADSYNREY